MLVTTETSLALRCAQCGRLDVHPLSLFAFSGNHTVRLTCSCGAHKLTVGQRGGQFYLQFPCFLCDHTHFLYFPRAAFWAPELKQIACPETGLDLGFFGANRPLEHAPWEGESADEAPRPSTAEERAQELVEEVGFDEYFENPQVMYQLLNRLHEMAANGKLHCVCGNPDVQVEVLPDRVELTCSTCGRWRPLVAESDQDLAQLDRLERLPAGEQGWREGDAPPRGGAPFWSH